MCVHTSHQPYAYHVLRYTHDNEHMRTHNAIHNIFAAITQDVDFHMGGKQLYTLPLTMFNSSHQQIDIMFIKNEIRTLVNIIIVDLTHVDLRP